MDNMRQLCATEDGAPLSNLELVPAADTDRVEELLGETDALLIATDDVGSVVDPAVLDYLLDPAKAPGLRRVTAMSRHLNGKGMGPFVTASRRAANAQVWDGGNAAAYREYEAGVQAAAGRCGAAWTVVRAGTLKGGAAGTAGGYLEDEADAAPYYPQYLHPSYYDMTKNDIVTWQLLFDCSVRGVRLTPGDNEAGPGMRAVFTATGSGEHAGDSGRCGVAEAMVRSLEMDAAANAEFGVGTAASREAPSDEEWEVLFRDCLS